MRAANTYGSYVLLALMGLGVLGCREIFDPEVGEEASGILVVEGYLDSEGLASELTLSWTSELKDSGDELSPALGATVYLLSEQGAIHSLEEQGEGVYLFQEDISEQMTYELHIELPGKGTYKSDPIQPILTPEILDAGYVRDETGIEVFVNTQGNDNADDFLWTYEETWVFLPRIITNFIYKEDVGVVERKEEERISRCYKSERNSGVLLETSSRFEDQVVFRQTIKEFEEGDPRMQERYSVLISQKAIPSDAVEFWETLKKNTEDIGTIFSPLPSLIGGNIHAVEASSTQKAIGYVSIGVVQQERVFIDRADILPWTISMDEFNTCFIGTDTIPESQYATVFASGSTLPARVVMGPMGPIGYYTAPRWCADCTLYANREKPDFWIE